ncbi:MAG: helix-turn-helix transcriptional regulator [Peptoniphilaceae bacterium]|nr:helix-turn-helix transcriptional regulator [Peptoniphilaceae bacterium]
MILADKIIELRKKNNWSQEELAAKLGVSRQAISKWESAQSIPDLERILKMSALFGVSTDTLIKDEIELSSAPINDTEDSEHSIRVISMEEANAYLALKEKGTRPIAFGVMLCVMSIIPISVSDGFRNEAVSEPIGVIIAFLFVLAGVALFLLNGLPLNAWKWMKEEPFETAYGVSGMVQERQRRLQPRLISHIVMGVCLCILTLVCFIASDLSGELIDLPENYFVAFGFGIAAIAVYLFVSVGIPYGAYKQLLQEGDYNPKNKAIDRKIGPIMGIYWLLTTAIFLGYSLLTMNWERSWIIWPVAGVLCGVLAIVLTMVYGNKDER